MVHLTLDDQLVICGQRFTYTCPPEIIPDEDLYITVFQITTENIMGNRSSAWHHAIDWDTCEVSWVGKKSNHHRYLRARFAGVDSVGVLAGLEVDPQNVTTNVLVYLYPPPPPQKRYRMLAAWIDRVNGINPVDDWVEQALVSYDLVKNNNPLSYIRLLMYAAQEDMGYHLFTLRGVTEPQMERYSLSREMVRERLDNMAKVT